MQINRYTKTSQARFNPMSLEELMMVPAYKRQQHDAMSSNLASVEAELAKVDSLDIHSDLARKEQERLYNQLKQQSDKLATEGFSNTTKSDILKLNKDYQQTIGPMGTIGKISNAKKVYEQQKADLLANGVKMGYGADKLKEELKKAYEIYKQGFDGKNITNFEAPMPPSYEDLQKDIDGAADAIEALLERKEALENKLRELNHTELIKN